MIKIADYEDLEGTSLIGYIPMTTPAAMDAFIGAQHRRDGDGYKTYYEWIFQIDGVPFSIYDYKGDNKWHVGGLDKKHLAKLRRVLPTLSITESEF